MDVPRSAVLRLTVYFLGALSLSVAPAAARADPEGPGLAVDWRVHVPIVVAGGAGWILSESVFKEELAGESCGWCGANGFDDMVRERLRWSGTETAHQLSNAIVYGVVPASAFGLTALAAWRDRRGGEWAENAFVVLEAAVLSSDLTQLVKFQAGRARPYMREDGALAGVHVDGNLSFFSGHTSFAFSLAVASGTVASMRGYRAAPAVWGVGLGAAAVTGYLRIAADRHYATDVMTGALVGSALGFAVPYLLHRRGRETREPPRLQMGVTPVAGGSVASLGFRW
jgi:membrane-associated phospholipid phosphatase